MSQDRMTTDNLWVREHSTADSSAKARTHGYHYLYYHVPNKRERIQMMWRSMGRQFDWELEKFRLQKKAPDRGNKKRWWKNMWRFFKHPVGYTYWKTYKTRTAKARLPVTAMGIGFALMIYKYKLASMREQKKNHYLLRAGKNLEGTSNTKMGYHDTKLARGQMPLTNLMYYDLPGHKIIVNPCRNQNYRLYFELRKKYGIKPSSYSE